MKDFIEHIERYLGTIEHGWTKSPSGKSMPFQIIECRGGVVRGAAAFMTLGLGQTELSSRVTQKLIRQELLITVRAVDATVGVPSLLQQVASDALTRREAYLRGDVIGPRGTIFEGSTMEAFYVTMPTYYPESFSTFEESAGCGRIIAWLLPITSKEAEYVRSRGWSEFETLLEKENPDLLNLNRSSIV
jgi:hypothetical protein